MIIYAARRTAERSDAATCKLKAQAEGFGASSPTLSEVVECAAKRGLGVGAKPLPPEQPK